MIASPAQFCQGFFHIDECFEWQQPVACIHAEPCKRMEVQGLVSVTVNGDCLFARLYQNQFRGHTEQNVHVEDQVVADRDLAAALGRPGPKVLTLYVGYQPCHYSAGGRKLHGAHAKSCTVLLIDWWRRDLRDRGVALHIKCLGVYRAQWEDAAHFVRADSAKPGDLDTFVPRANAAREGIQRILREPGVHMTGMTPADWLVFLRRHCRPEAHRAVTPAQWTARFAYDARVCEFLEKMRA